MLRQLERSAVHLLAKRGKSQREIARELGLSRVTVSRVLREPIDKKPAKRNRRSSVDPFADQIKQWLGEKLTIVRMLELARADPDHPYTGGRSVFSDHVRKIRLEQDRLLADVPIGFEGLAGEYLQVDWGEVRHFPFTQQKPATRYFLACRLKYSRWTFVRWTTRMDQETLIRLLVECFLTLGFVPWVLVFDNMKTVTIGRDPDNKPIWHPTFLQFAREFDFHSEACAVGAGNQKGSVESLVKWVKGNFLVGRSFVDDVDLDQQCLDWLRSANCRPSSATREPPILRLEAERAKGSPLPASATNYGFIESARVNREALVHVRGNVYSVPVANVGLSVSVRLHRQTIVIWRDTLCLAEHTRAPDGAHRRVIVPEHFSPLFGKKPRARMMLERQALLELGGSATSFVAGLSRRRRDCLGVEISALHELYQRFGQTAFLAATSKAELAGVYRSDYVALMLEAPRPDDAGELGLPGVPKQSEVDRLLSSYEEWVSGAGLISPVPRGVEQLAEVTR
ncbi:MAG: IS21 family transposase [Chloroflexi bacterium]|nr:IS21 family transposase [Chloroflexota bacterium]